ncbi:hypothetical protein D3C87_1508750 [compost metagenome]
MSRVLGVEAHAHDGLAGHLGHGGIHQALDHGGIARLLQEDLRGDHEAQPHQVGLQLAEPRLALGRKGLGGGSDGLDALLPGGKPLLVPVVTALGQAVLVGRAGHALDEVVGLGLGRGEEGLGLALGLGQELGRIDRGHGVCRLDRDVLGLGDADDPLPVDPAGLIALDDLAAHDRPRLSSTARRRRRARR